MHPSASAAEDHRTELPQPVSHRCCRATADIVQQPATDSSACPPRSRRARGQAPGRAGGLRAHALSVAAPPQRPPLFSPARGQLAPEPGSQGLRPAIPQRTRAATATTAAARRACSWIKRSCRGKAARKSRRRAGWIRRRLGNAGRASSRARVPASSGGGLETRFGLPRTSRTVTRGLAPGRLASASWALPGFRHRQRSP